ncbi:GGDEF domain-containing protein [Dyella telluris]|uniref:diguanylate cyclase n=1 Tax=Dyella telluris TaxID=2763498 RepID=A0A7G8Q2C1_9GAMM|nr:diguanylate cyclase [Dyella telluris]QNK00929.1 diguanylate cyclase [Dyella telluris]
MPSTAPAGESISRRFRLAAMAIYLMVVALVLALFVLQWRGYRDAYEAKKEFNVLHAVLGAMADVSSERRPSYAVAVLQEPAPQEWLAAKRAARLATDQRMDQLVAALHDRDCRNCPLFVPIWEGANAQLVSARRNIDTLSHQTHTDDDIIDAFARLSTVVPQLSSITEIGSLGIVRENADVQSYLLVARLSGLLRERAGMIVSLFTPAVVSRRAMTDKELFEVARTIGEIDQLHQLLHPSIRVLPPSLQSDFTELDRRYFGDGLALIDRVRQQAVRPGGVDALPLQLSEEYAPLVAPINQFRDDALALAGKTIDHSLHAHLIYLIASGIFAALLTGMLLLIMWRFREKIIEPVAEARRFILAMASGHASAALPPNNYSNEMQELFSALNILKKNDDKRMQLEQERKRLIGELQVMAETDALTGLFNRRALESRARVLFADQRHSDPVIALMLLDIDHFKRVNDTYGHDSGDKALVALAGVCRDTVRTDDIVARFGGEEFVILLRVQTADQARALAERLRLRIRGETMVAADGQSFSVTISIGVAFARHADGVAIDIDELMRDADALLYRAKEGGRDRVESAAA